MTTPKYRRKGETWRRICVNALSIVAMLAGGHFLAAGTNTNIGIAAVLLTWANFHPISK